MNPKLITKMVVGPLHQIETEKKVKIQISIPHWATHYATYNFSPGESSVWNGSWLPLSDSLFEFFFDFDGA